ncbi:TPA: alpha-2,3 sialyltransferase [Campylobacter jejuni]|nr:alpha-2,3 sialyltransferase [Campylobacter jejuni]HDZ5089898.1 alpha-2,3 sialyltransferase [Campylobacter jejuni]HDZ5091556.1 alpha-2,3 sialyltransferase [Campylobacter jejuni]HDZ5100583.1 alpha-2,3 sialyltransferase [Campylobacter jejuni]HDZ5106332.1 alpha-2,3 sialyltransferase [Campylobacter jejuni]
MKKNNVIVAGNGPSLKEIDYSRLPSDFDVFRCNQFYFEDRYYLGKNIQAVFFFPGNFFEQYYTTQILLQRQEYFCKNIVCKIFPIQHHAYQKSLRNFNNIFPIFFPAAYDGNKKYISKLHQLNHFLNFIFTYNKGMQITTGIYAVACAVACGYKNIYITGIDFYNTPNYAYEISDKKGLHGLNPSFVTGYIKSHSKEIDLKVLNFLSMNYQVNFFSISPNSPITEYIPLAPQKHSIFNIEDKPLNSIKDILIPPKESYKKYSKALYLENNICYNFLHDFYKFPSALKNYLKNISKSNIRN